MKFHIVALSVLTTFANPVAAQAPAEQSAGIQAPSPAAVEAVYEAVVRYQIKSWDLGAAAYCIRIKGEDADDKFLHKLKPLPVKPASECLEKKDKMGMTVIDKHSKKKSVLLGAGSILWRSDTQADVQGSYLCGSQCMSGGIYHVIRDGEQWRVTKYDVYISE
jgi:hypothetical protein